MTRRERERRDRQRQREALQWMAAINGDGYVRCGGVTIPGPAPLAQELRAAVARRDRRSAAILYRKLQAWADVATIPPPPELLS